MKRAPLSLLICSIVAAAQEPEAELPVIPNRLTAPPIATLKPSRPADDWAGRSIRAADGRYHLPTRGKPALTLAPALHEGLNRILEEYAVPYGAVVALEPASGRILALSEHSQERPSLRGLCTRAVYPAASIFKIVTAAALLEAGLKPEDQACSHGGEHRLTEKLLLDSPRDRACYSLSAALAKSANVVFAKLTHKFLSAETLRRFAGAFRFNRPLDADIPTEVSLAAIPDDSFKLAATGAGFGDVYLSPLHGAMLASVVANGGLWKAPFLLEGAGGSAAVRALGSATARTVGRMMEETVTMGTARRLFRQRGFAVRSAAGKTGTLADRKPFRDYSWFVGYAPAVNPRIAVAAVVVNGPQWRIRATYLGREAMRLYLQANAAKAAPPKEPTQDSKDDEREELSPAEEDTTGQSSPF